MAAGRQSKRLSSSNLHEHYKGRKKKRLDSSNYFLNLRSHVHLQWDDGLKRVVAKREQIGITWKEISPYIECPKLQLGLADVFSFPKEVFDLDNLVEVLSYEVWLTCLSESERKLLMQFLPSCSSAEQTVRLLLSGKNLHFGNPFLKWSTMLCSSYLHPDGLLYKDQEIRQKRKQYFMAINKYHSDMIEVLRMLKEESETRGNPSKLWRMLSNPNYNNERVDEEKLNTLPTKKKETMKICNLNMDATKYIAYIKVNKMQFQMVKDVKHSSDGIHSKSLSRVLGDINNYHMYSYESYVDENNTFGENWMQIAKDAPAAFEEFNKRKFLRAEHMKCLNKELAGSRALVHCEVEEAVLENSSAEIDHLIEMTDEKGSAASLKLTRDLIMMRLPSRNSRRQLSPSSSDQETHYSHSLKITNDGPTSKLIESLDSCQISNELKPLISPLKGSWIAVQHQPSQACVSASGEVLFKEWKHVNDRPTPIKDFERDIKQEARHSLCSTLDVDPTSQLLGSYSGSNAAVNRAFLMSSDLLPQHTYASTDDLSQSEHRFVMDAETLPENNQFSLIKVGQASEKLLCDQDKIRHSDHIGYYPLSICPQQTDIANGFGQRNWFPDEPQPHDGNLFSIFPEFRDLSCRSLLNTSDSVQAQDYVGMNLANLYTHAQMSSSTGYDSGVNPSMNVSWMNHPSLNPSFQENARKQFTRHWRQ